MGQLEKYGLYVLCLVIFLILGVAIWGGDSQAAGGSQASPLAGQGEPGARQAPRKDGVRGSVVNPADALLDLFAKADLPKPPVKEAEKGGDKGGEKGSDKSGDKTFDKGADKGRDKGDTGKGKEGGGTPADASRPKYKIKPGDTLEEIAIAQLGSRTHVAEIKKLNPGVEERNLKAGSELLLPSKAELAGTPPSNKKDQGKDPATDGKTSTWRWYTFKRGDTYEGVSRSLFHDVSHVDAIKKLNPSLDPNRVRAGTEIKVPVQ